MAAFSQQFSAFNPRDFRGSGPFAVLADALAMDANMFIGAELSRSDLIEICKCIESELALQIPDEPTRFVDCRAEIDILECAIDDGVDLCADLECNPKQHEQLAAYALWKVADLCSITDITQPAQLEMVNVAIASASTALQIAAALVDDNYLGRLTTTMLAG